MNSFTTTISFTAITSNNWKDILIRDLVLSAIFCMDLVTLSWTTRREKTIYVLKD